MARDGGPNLPDAVAVSTAPPMSSAARSSVANWRDSGDPGRQAWDPAQRAWTWRGSSAELIPTVPIEIERYDGPLLLTHGMKGTTWSVSMTRRLEERPRPGSALPPRSGPQPRW